LANTAQGAPWTKRIQLSGSVTSCIAFN